MRKLSLLQRGLRVNHFETVRRRKDGSLLDISLTISPVRDRNGRIIGASKIARDITERRCAEQLRGQLSAIVESSGDAIYIYDFEGKVVTWNRAAEELYGYSEREMVGRPIDTLIPADLKEEVPNFQGSKTVRNLESQRVRRDGTVFPVLLTISPVRGPRDEVVGVSVIARDISDQKQSEEALREGQKLESLGLLAGGIAHEFNNLLTGVLGNASLLAGDLFSGSREWEMAQSIIESAERMARLTSQMLAYSGRGHFVIERVDLSRQIGRMINLIHASMPKEVELRMSLAEDLPLVEVDASQLQQVILNLLINAAEAAGGRGVVQVKTSVEVVGEQELRANLARTEPLPGCYAVVAVEDNGCGMDEGTRARIFDPFFTTKFMGRGLGLSSVLGIVRGHKGIITVDSTPGAGTTVCVYFPIAEIHHPAPPVRARENQAVTVLIVDDEEVVRQTAGRALRGLGYEVITAANGVEALHIYAAEAHRINVVLLDTMMPVMGGEETLRRLHETWPEATVLVMSGYQESEVRERFGGRTAGFLQKPFTAGQLAIKIHAALRSSST